MIRISVSIVFYRLFPDWHWRVPPPPYNSHGCNLLIRKQVMLSIFVSYRITRRESPKVMLSSSTRMQARPSAPSGISMATSAMDDRCVVNVLLLTFFVPNSQSKSQFPCEITSGNWSTAEVQSVLLRWWNDFSREWWYRCLTSTTCTRCIVHSILGCISKIRMPSITAA